MKEVFCNTCKYYENEHLTFDVLESCKASVEIHKSHHSVSASMLGHQKKMSIMIVRITKQNYLLKYLISYLGGNKK